MRLEEFCSPRSGHELIQVKNAGAFQECFSMDASNPAGRPSNHPGPAGDRNWIRAIGARLHGGGSIERGDWFAIGGEDRGIS